MISDKKLWSWVDSDRTKSNRGSQGSYKEIAPWNSMKQSLSNFQIIDSRCVIILYKTYMKGKFKSNALESVESEDHDLQNEGNGVSYQSYSKYSLDHINSIFFSKC